MFVPTRCLRGENPEQGRDFDVTKVFRDAVMAENDREWSRKTDCYHPSAIGGCKRALYYDRTGEEPKSCWNFQTLMYFLLGHALHDMVQNKLSEAMGQTFEAETTIEFKELKIYGHCDGVFASEDWILEIKTAGSSTFNSLIRPKSDHIRQIHCYMAALDIPRCQLVYVNRDNGSLKKFDIFFEEEIWSEIVGVIARIEEAVESNDPPEREVSRWTCRTCKFKHICEPPGI